MKTSTLVLTIVAFLFLTTLTLAQVTSAGSGDWSGDSTWVGGAVPASNDNVVIGDGHKVVLNADAVCNNLTIDGTLEFEKVTARTLTVNGNLTGDSLKTASIATGSGPLIHSIVLYGDLAFTSLFDLRYGSNPDVGAADLIITGSTNSTLSGPGNMDVNGVTINKTGGAKVFLASNFRQNNNSSNPPLGTLNLISGIIETGEFEWHVRATGSASGVQGASSASYINGTVVVYFPGGSGTKLFPLGDGDVYRPISLYTYSGTSNSGMRGTIVHADANTGSSIFSGDIDLVSSRRYYAFQNASNNVFNFKYIEPSYGEDDGVNTGNTDLRVAVSTDSMATWIGKGPETSHTTDLTNPPTFIMSDTLDPVITRAAQERFYVALARKAGTVTNELPVELVNFNAAVVDGNVVLNWTTATEKNNSGFEIQKSTDNKSFIRIGFIEGAGTSSELKKYSYIDRQGSAGRLYYRLKQIDFDGKYEYSKVVEVNAEIPEVYSLQQNYPNPFNPSTTIKYSLPESGFVTLKIYDMLGNLVKSIVNELQNSGLYAYSVDFSELASGTYIYELKVNSFVQRNKMLLLK